MSSDGKNIKAKNSRKRKADDALDRLAESSSDHLASGRGAVAGWTTCPLCGRHSPKKYALGRGISSHLYAVHTPWKPGKMERKKRRRIEERRQAELAKEASHGGSIHGVAHEEDENHGKILEIWTPSQREVEEWDATVLKIVAELESQAGEALAKKTSVGFVRAGLDRHGNESKSYRESLPSFIQAAADGDLDKLKEMVASAISAGSIQLLLATRDRHLSTAAHWAAGGGHLSCLRFLLECSQKHAVDEESGGNPKRARRRDGKTCLHYAARNGHLEIVLYLIEQLGYTLDEASGDGTTPFHMACFGGHPHVADYLIRAGARAHATNNWGCTAAHFVAMAKSESFQQVRDVCSLLLGKGLSFAKAQGQGHSALHKAAQRQNRHFIEWVLQSSSHGGAGLTPAELCDASQPDDGGHTPAEIWRFVGGDEAFAKLMESALEGA